MKTDGRLWFAGLWPGGAGAVRKVRVTAGMAGALALAAAAWWAATFPEPAPPSTWAAALGAAWLAAALGMLWRYRPDAAWGGAAHYAIRVALAGLALGMLWGWAARTVGVVEELSRYSLGPLLWGLVLWPAGDVQKEALARSLRPPPRLRRAWIWTRHVQWALLLVGAATVVTGVFVEMRKEYPVDPTYVLAVLWPMVMGGVIACLARAAGQSRAVAGKAPARRPLDDPPPGPPRGPAGPGAPRFSPDDW